MLIEQETDSKTQRCQSMFRLTKWGFSLIVGFWLVLCLLLNQNVLAQSRFVQNDHQIIGIIKSEYLTIVRELIDRNDIANPSTLFCAKLRTAGVVKVEDYIDRASSFSNYIVLTYDTTRGVASILDELEQTGYFTKLWKSVAQSRELLGCYPYVNRSEYINDPAYGDAWYIDSPVYVDDQDMSFPEAWEFTFGSDSVRISTIGGPALFPQWRKNSAAYREMTSQVDSGFDWHWLTNVVTIPPDDTTLYHLYYPDTLLGQQGEYDHSLACMRTIVGQHDTTTAGVLGVAPRCRVYPMFQPSPSVWGYYVACAISNNIKVFTVSERINSPDPGIETAIDSLLAHDIVPVFGYGNDGRVTQVNNNGAIRVASNIGRYRLPTSSYRVDNGIAPTLTSAGAFGGETSFATTVVGGVLGLMKSFYPQASMLSLRDKLLSSLLPMNDSKWDPDTSISGLGAGRLDAYVALSTVKSGDITDNQTWNGPIYVPKDLIITPNATVTIDLTPGPNGLARTHVRFGCENDTGGLIVPKIKVYGTLIVRGSASEKILFSPLSHRFFSNGTYLAHWGGIEVMEGGTLSMDHAMIEKADNAILTFSKSVEVTNTEICESGMSGVVVDLAPNQGGSTIPVIRKCNIHDGLVQTFGTGVSVWRGEAIVDSCDISKVHVGVHVTGMTTGGSIQYSRIHDTFKAGILHADGAGTDLLNDTIFTNQGAGVIYSNSRYDSRISGCSIFDNGRAGFQDSNPNRSADALYLDNTRVYAMNNSIASSRHGFHIENHSILYGGNGTYGFYGAHGFNQLDSCIVSYFAQDESRGSIGIRTNNVNYGGTNTSVIDPSNQNAYHASADNTSVLYLQCNTWYPYDPSKFGWNCIHTPWYGDCYPQPPVEPWDAFQIARDSMLAGNINYALLEYGTLAFQGDYTYAKIALGGYRETSMLNVNRNYETVIDSVLQALATYYQGGPADLRASIAATQGSIAIMRGNYAAADSALKYATANLNDNAAQLNAEVMLMYLHLYKNHDIIRADSLLSDLYARYPGDSLLVTACLLRRYCPDIETALYTPKHSIQNIATDDRIRPDASVQIVGLYPNPSDANATLYYRVNEAVNVRITVANILGQTIATLLDERKEAGRYLCQYNVENLPSGLYSVIATGGNAVISTAILIRK